MAPLRRLAVAAAMLAIPTVAGATPVRGPDFWHSPMTFSYENNNFGRDLIYATGEIMFDSADALKAALDTHNVRPGTLIIFHSPGGNPFGGMEMGRLIRARSLDTLVGQRPQARGSHSVTSEQPIDPGECDSSCTLAFLGGVYRTIPEGSTYGVHDVSTTDKPKNPFAEGQTVAATISGFLQDMDIDPALLSILVRFDSSRDQIYYVPPAMLGRLRVTTSALNTHWEFGITNGSFVLTGANPNSSAVPGEHDQLELSCRTQEKLATVDADFLPPQRTVFSSELTPALFAQRVTGYKLATSNPKLPALPLGTPDPSAIIGLDEKDILAPARPAGEHHVRLSLAVTPKVMTFLRSARDLNIRFYTTGTDYYGFVVDLGTGRSKVLDFVSACTK